MRLLLFVPAFFVVVHLGACKEAHLSDVEVASAKGAIRSRAPAGAGWSCTPHDAEKESYAYQGIKCKDAEGIVLTAKLYEVSVTDARTAQLFCMQDWKAAYGSMFGVIASSTSNVIDWNGVPACEVVLEGTTQKGPWRIWELHAPNGRKMLQMNVSGSLPVLQKKSAVVDAWKRDVRYDLKLPGQT
jgi:hypothetical protein